MNRLNREWEVKLSMLGAIAKSQEALARILESIADTSNNSAGPSPAILREHVRVLSDLQAALLGTVTGISWRKPKRGKPTSPWLSGRLKIQGKARK